MPGCHHYLRDGGESGHPAWPGARPPACRRSAKSRAGPRSRSRWRRDLAGPRGGDRGRALGRGQRRARRAALPRRRSTRSCSGAPARRRLDGRGRPPARGRAAGVAAGRRRPVSGCPGGLSHRRIDGRRRGAVPRVPAAAAPPVRRSGGAEPPTRARSAWRCRRWSCRVRETRSACRLRPRVARSCRCRATTACERTSKRWPPRSEHGCPAWSPATTRQLIDGRAGRARGSRLGARCPRESRRRRPGTQLAAHARAWRDPRRTRPRSSSA